MKTVLCVHREKAFSGKPEKDNAILNSASSLLSEKGLEVKTLSAESLSLKNPDLILSMARSNESLILLKAMQKQGSIVINSPESILNTLNRQNAYSLLQTAGLSIPKTSLEPLRPLAAKGFSEKIVLKRPDMHGFTQIALDKPSFQEAIAFFRARGIENALVQRFIQGPHIKFYGVAGKVFLSKDSKTLSSKNIKELKSAAVNGSNALGLKVFGGDALIENNKVFLVDFNDWPSFSHVQKKAAPEIAGLALKKLKLIDVMK